MKQEPYTFWDVLSGGVIVSAFVAFIVGVMSIPTTRISAAESPCYFAGSVAKCFPSSGIYLHNQRALRLGTDNQTNYVELRAPVGMSTNKSFTLPSTYGSLSQVLAAIDTAGGLGWSDPGVSAAAVTSAIASTSSRRVADIVCHTDVASTAGGQTCDGQNTSGLFSALLMGQGDPEENGYYLLDDFSGWTPLSTAGVVAGGLYTVNDAGLGDTYQRSLWLGYGDGGSTNNFLNVPTTAGNNVLTASRAIVSDGNSRLAASATTSTELAYVSGVTSAIQTQLSAKLNKAGTTTNDNAAAGVIGEYASVSTVRSSPTALTTNTTANVASALSLTAGDWDLDGMVGFVPGAATSTGVFQAAISTTTGTLPGTDTFGVADAAGQIRAQYALVASVISNDVVFLTVHSRVSISGTTSYYLVAQSTFTISTNSAYGSLTARRVR